MSIYRKDKNNIFLTRSKSENQLIKRKRIQFEKFSEIIRNKIFKGYNKIKFMKSKDFNMNEFLSQNQAEKYLLTSEKYNIYYENKYLKKCKTDSKYASLFLKNSLIINKDNKKKKPTKNNSISFSSTLNKEKNNQFTPKRFAKPILSYMESGKLRIDDELKITKNEEENKIFSKYPFIIFDKTPDNIYNPVNLNNYPHYNPKYKQKNRNQQSFLFNLSHQKIKKVKNIFRCQTPHINFKNNSYNNYKPSKASNKYNFVSFSYSTIKENSLNLINSIKTPKLKKFLLKRKDINFFN